MLKTALLILTSCTLLSSAKEPAKFIQNLDAGEKQTIVAFGTSLTKVGAWVDQLRVSLEQAYPGQSTVFNGAQGGANSDWGRSVLKENVLDHKPDAVFIEFSINDSVLSRRTSIEHCQGNLEHFIDSILAQNPECEVILQVMNVCTLAPRRERPELEAYNQMYRDVAKARGLRLIDHWSNWQNLLDTDPKTFVRYIPDTVHPIREGALKVITPHLFKELGFTKEVSPEKSQDTPMWQYFFHMTRDHETQSTTTETYEKFWSKLFTRSDLSQNQTLDAKELCSESLLKAIDTDKSGEADMAEWQALFRPLFEEQDLNNDGKDR